MTWGGQREAQTPGPLKFGPWYSHHRQEYRGGHIRKESVCGVPLWELADIGSQKSGPKMLVHGDLLISLVMLGGFLQGDPDTVFPSPSKARK